MLYQLSYSRERTEILAAGPRPRNRSATAPWSRGAEPVESGGEGDRTPDLVNAIHALSQLSYAPANHRATTGLYWRPAEPPDGNTACYRGVPVVSS